LSRAHRPSRHEERATKRRRLEEFAAREHDHGTALQQVVQKRRFNPELAEIDHPHDPVAEVVDDVEVVLNPRF
jgi:hypothetical protein